MLDVSEGSEYVFHLTLIFLNHFVTKSIYMLAYGAQTIA